MFRLIYLTFYGTSRHGPSYENMYMSPRCDGRSVMALGVLSILGGFLGFPPEQAGSINSLHRSRARERKHDVTPDSAHAHDDCTGIALLGWPRALFL